MEVRPLSAMLKGDGRTGTFNHDTTHRDKQSLDPRPFKRSVDGIAEYRFKGFSVLVVHGFMITLSDSMSI
jgi:hypothetical protein